MKEAAEINYDNCIEKMTPDGWEVIVETEEEYYRRGHFERIFPPKDINKLDYYIQFFECNRYNN